MEQPLISNIPTVKQLNQKLNQQMMSKYMKEHDVGKRIFGNAVDIEIKMCFDRFFDAYC